MRILTSREVGDEALFPIGVENAETAIMGAQLRATILNQTDIPAHPKEKVAPPSVSVKKPIIRIFLAQLNALVIKDNKWEGVSVSKSETRGISILLYS